MQAEEAARKKGRRGKNRDAKEEARKERIFALAPHESENGGSVADDNKLGA